VREFSSPDSIANESQHLIDSGASDKAIQQRGALVRFWQASHPVHHRRVHRTKDPQKFRALRMNRKPEKVQTNVVAKERRVIKSTENRCEKELTEMMAK